MSLVGLVLIKYVENKQALFSYLLRVLRQFQPTNIIDIWYICEYFTVMCTWNLRNFSVMVPFSCLNLIFSKTSRSTSVWTFGAVSLQHKWFLVMPVGYLSIDNGNIKTFNLLHLRLFKNDDDIKKRNEKKAIKLVVKRNNLFLSGQCKTMKTVLLL